MFSSDSFDIKNKITQDKHIDFVKPTKGNEHITLRKATQSNHSFIENRVTSSYY